MSPRKSATKSTSAKSASSAAASAPAAKRKAAPSQSDSEVEIVEVMTRRVKKARPATPDPGSPGFEVLPAVSFTTSKFEDDVFGNIPGLNFGSVEDDDSGLLPASEITESQSPKTPKRAPSSRRKVKTEKAREAPTYDESPSTVPVQPTADKTGVSPKRRVSSLKKIENTEASPKGKTDAQPAKPISKPISASGKSPVTVKLEDRQASEALASDGDGEGESVAALSDPDVDRESVKSGNERSTPKRSESPEVAVIDLAVMRRDLQDPALYKIYEGLPLIRRFADVIPFNSQAGGSSQRVAFSALCRVLDDKGRRSLLRGLMFTQAGCYVNTSRIDPAKLVVGGGCLRLAGGRINAVGIMMGVITECFMFDPIMVGPPASAYAVHRVTITPFAQEMRRDTSLWGHLFDFRAVTGPVSSNGISFSTRKRAEFSNSGPSSPSKNGGIFMTVTSPLTPLALPSGSGNGTFYPQSRAFEENLPIYDARQCDKGFGFSDGDFAKLSTWPLYGKGKKDLPTDESAVVAVGYTLGTYLNAKTQDPVLSANLQFVILLGRTQ